MKNQVLIEVSWEVCNLVGGIYTVLSSKAYEGVKNFGDNYILIGPLKENQKDFKETNDAVTVKIRNHLYQNNFQAKVGRWNIPGEPVTILLKINNYHQKNEILYWLWEQFQVDSLGAGWDYEEPVLFGIQAGRVVEALYHLFENENIISHFHEWMTGSGLLYLKKNAPEIKTVFTTHATVLGRSLAGNGYDLYNMLEQINPDSSAELLQVKQKHQLEKTISLQADVFTTVSQITALEAEYFFRRKAVITPNGFNTSVSLKDAGKSKKFLVEFAASFAETELNEQNCVLIGTSGRYEFRNKGIDILLEALAEVNKQNANSSSSYIVAYLFIAASKSNTSSHGFRHSILTHDVINPDTDPILQKCRELHLTNDKNQRVKIIFVPVYLDGSDEKFPFTYYQLLQGLDLTLFPSFYEPWGYTPLESIAYGIPTVTSDLSGFGQWVNTRFKNHPGVNIVKRYKKDDRQAIRELAEVISKHILPDHFPDKKEILSFAANFSWEKFYNYYLEVYQKLIEMSTTREAKNAKKMNENFIEIKASESSKPRFRSFAVRNVIPEKLIRLRELAYNLWWSWNPEAYQLFNQLNPVLMEQTNNNPVALLENLPPDTLEEMAHQQPYLMHYESVMKKFDQYMGDKKPKIALSKLISQQSPIVYLSMEYGFHESLPIYSGGLGVLSGDHIKSSSDLNIPLIGIGLLYRKGYFKQEIKANGQQIDHDVNNDFSLLPITEVLIDDKPLEIVVQLAGRNVFAKVWKVQVGKVPVYLFDTDLIKNSPSDREITGRLYGGGKIKRIEQEILLGIGGIRLLKALNIKPSVFHMNEGHSAFLIVERIIDLMREEKISFEVAREVVKAGNVFTTHTPVPAGNETFNMQLIVNYFKNYIEENGISWEQFLSLTERTPQQTHDFEMTVLALKNSNYRNGVSKLHGIVSRNMWAKLWESLPVEEIPIKHVTNGVHAGTWLHAEIKKLYVKYGIIDLESSLIKKNGINKIDSISDKDLWTTHQSLKTRFLNYTKERLTAWYEREGFSHNFINQTLSLLRNDVLTIGFARRFATYKRATLIFQNPDRLKRILLNKEYPVQIIFAGKAHPNDTEGQQLIQQIINWAKDENLAGKIVFLEDYDVRLARKMVASVDVWLNNPLRPHEASGTSGMKTAINGVLNFSILDGWWDEAFDPSIGWAIGNRQKVENIEIQNQLDTESLYDTLENKIIPLYYRKNPSGIPVQWVNMMKNSMKEVLFQFNTHRMLKDYSNDAYNTAAEESARVIKDNYSLAIQLNQWKSKINQNWSSVHIKQVLFNENALHDLNLNQSFKISVFIDKGALSSNDLTAQLILLKDTHSFSRNANDEKWFFDEDLKIINMQKVQEKENIIEYFLEYKATEAGKYNYGIRIVPAFDGQPMPYELNLVRWF